MKTWVSTTAPVSSVLTILHFGKSLKFLNDLVEGVNIRQGRRPQFLDFVGILILTLSVPPCVRWTHE